MNDISKRVLKMCWGMLTPIQQDTVMRATTPDDTPSLSYRRLDEGEEPDEGQIAIRIVNIDGCDHTEMSVAGIDSWYRWDMVSGEPKVIPRDQPMASINLVLDTVLSHE